VPVKVSLRLFLVLFDGGNKDGAEIGGRCRRRGSVGHLVVPVMRGRLRSRESELLGRRYASASAKP
jgi:hypothetical protein